MFFPLIHCILSGSFLNLFSDIFIQDVSCVSGLPRQRMVLDLSRMAEIPDVDQKFTDIF